MAIVADEEEIPECGITIHGPPVEEYFGKPAYVDLDGRLYEITGVLVWPEKVIVMPSGDPQTFCTTCKCVTTKEQPLYCGPCGEKAAEDERRIAEMDAPNGD